MHNKPTKLHAYPLTPTTRAGNWKKTHKHKALSSEFDVLSTSIQRAKIYTKPNNIITSKDIAKDKTRIRQGYSDHITEQVPPLCARRRLPPNAEIPPIPYASSSSSVLYSLWTSRAWRRLTHCPIPITPVSLVAFI